MVSPLVAHAVTEGALGRPLEGGLPSRELVEALARHRVTNLVLRSAAQGAVSSLLVEAQRASTLGALGALALQADVLACLRDAGVNTLVLKGIPIASETARDPLARDTRDLDVIVDSADARRAARALEEMGLFYTPPRPWSGLDPDPVLKHAHALRGVKDAEFGGPAGIVELHWRLTANPRLMPFDPAWLQAPRHIDVAGAAVPVLPLLAGWWHLHVHGTEHAWYRLKWVADVLAVAWTYPDEVLSEASLKRTEAAGLRRCVATGLMIAETTFGAFLPTHARAWAERTPGAHRHVEAGLAALSGPEPPPLDHTLTELPAYIWRRMTLRRDPGFKAEEVRCILVAAARSQESEHLRGASVLRESLRRLRRQLA